MAVFQTHHAARFNNCTFARSIPNRCPQQVRSALTPSSPAQGKGRWRMFGARLGVCFVLGLVQDFAPMLDERLLASESVRV